MLVCPSLRVTGLRSDIGDDDVLARRVHEPWHAEAVAALRAEATSPQELLRYRMLAAPLLYGEWNEAAAEPGQFTQAATDGFYDGFTPDPALPGRLADLSVPVLLVAGEHDIWPTAVAVEALAALLGDVEVAVMPGAGHFPWVDDAFAFAAIVDGFLATSP